MILSCLGYWAYLGQFAVSNILIQDPLHCNDIVHTCNLVCYTYCSFGGLVIEDVDEKEAPPLPEGGAVADEIIPDTSADAKVSLTWFSSFFCVRKDLTKDCSTYVI